MTTQQGREPPDERPEDERREAGAGPGDDGQEAEPRGTRADETNGLSGFDVRQPLVVHGCGGPRRAFG
jgi:hypothetical protein